MTKSMLIVEDEESMRSIYWRIFSAEGYDITLATTLAEGRELMNGSSYDLIITDLVLSDGAGTELLAQAAGKQTPPGLMLVSGAIEEWEVPLFIEKYSLARCFTKPFPVDSLVQAVKDFFGRA